jgi:hypothetical protein
MNCAAGNFRWMKTLCCLTIIPIKKYKELQNVNNFFNNLQVWGGGGKETAGLLIVKQFISECKRLNQVTRVKF